MTSHALEIALVSLALGSACTAEPPPDDDVELVAANKVASGLVTRSGVIAFRDGVEASSDPSVVGVDVRVVDRDGLVTTVGPSALAIRDLALLDDAVATIELTETVEDRHVAIRPFEGDPIAVSHPAIPMAIASTAGGLVWIEAQIGGRIGDAYAIELALVEADGRGEVLSRMPIVPSGFVPSTPYLGWFPDAFGLVVDGDLVHFGWSTERRNSEVFRIDRDTGVATIEWQGRGRYSESDMEPAEVGLALHVWNGELVVAGGIYQYAAVAPEAGFVAYRDTTTRTPEALWYAAGDGSTLFVAHGVTLEQFDGVLTPLSSEAPAPIWGLALDGSTLLMTTDDALYVRQL